MYHAKNSEFRFSRLRRYLKFWCESGINKGFVLALNSEIRLSKLNSSKHIKVYCFLFKVNDLLYQFTLMEFPEVIMAIH